MAYYDSEFFLGAPPQDFNGVPFQPAGFDGTFTLLDGELVYIVPPGKQGNVSIYIQYRTDEGAIITDIGGSELPIFTDTISVAGGSVSADIGSTFDPVTGTWEDISVLSSLVSALGDGETLDLTGRGFAIVGDQATSGPISISGKHVTIEGAHVCSGQEKSWTQCGASDTYWAPLYSAASDISDVAVTGENVDPSLAYLCDFGAASHPRQAMPSTYKPSNPDQDMFRRTWSSNWTEINGLGSNFSSVTLTGTDKTKFDAVVAGMDDITDCTITYRSNPSNVYTTDRVASYDSGSGVLVLDSWLGTPTNDDLFDFAPYGTEIRSDPDNVSLDEAGTYTIDVKRNRVYYRPVNVSTLVNTLVPHRSGHFRINSNANAELTLINCTLTGSANNTTGSLGATTNSISLVAGENPINVSGCIWDRNFKNVSAGVVTAYRCVFNQAGTRNLVCNHGSDIQRCMFLESEGKSNFLLYGPTGSGDTLRRSVIKNNFTKIQYAVHGQGMSFYKGSWRDLDATGNIFYNCEGPTSSQDSGIQANAVVANDYVFSNNLFYHSGDRSFIYDQAGIAILNADVVAGLNDNLTVDVRNNTATNATYDSDPSGYSETYSPDGPCEFGMQNFDSFDVPVSITFGGNIGSLRTLKIDAGELATVVSYDNILGYSTTADQSWGLYDAGSKGEKNWEIGNLFEADTSTISSTANALVVTPITGGADTTVSTRDVGIQWSSNPTGAELAAILDSWNVDWADDHTPQALPAVTPDPDPTNASSESAILNNEEDYRGGWPVSLTDKGLFFGYTVNTSSGGIRPGIKFSNVAEAFCAVNDLVTDQTTDTPPVFTSPDPDWVRLSTSTVWRLGTGSICRFDMNCTDNATAVAAAAAWNGYTTRTLKVMSDTNVLYEYDLSGSFFDAAVAGTTRCDIGKNSGLTAIAEAIIADWFDGDWDSSQTPGAPAANGNPAQFVLYGSSSTPTSSEVFDIDFTAMTSSTDVYVDDSTTADIDGITFSNYIEPGTVWMVGSGGSDSPYDTDVHLYKQTGSTGNNFSAAMAGDIITAPSAWTMEGVVAEGAQDDNADYGWILGGSSDGTNQIRAVINGNTGELRIRTWINSNITYQDTVSIGSIGSSDQQFLRASYDGTTLTVTCYNGTDDSGTLMGTATTTTLPAIGTYFGFLAGSGSTSSTRSRSAFSMKLTDDS